MAANAGDDPRGEVPVLRRLEAAARRAAAGRQEGAVYLHPGGGGGRGCGIAHRGEKDKEVRRLDRLEPRLDVNTSI